MNDWNAFFGDPFRAISPLLGVGANAAREIAEMRNLRQSNAAGGVEWFEDAESFHARVELPGVKRDELRLDVEGGLIRITRETSVSDGNEASRFSKCEFVLRCPDGVRSSGIEARLADGILHLDLPKEEARKPVNIMIR